jgi:hypothetical protein
MRTIYGSRRVQFLIRFCIFLIMAALIAGMAGCDGYTPSQNLEIQTWYDLDDVRDNLEGHHTLMNDLDSTTAGYEELAGPTANQGKGWQPIGTGNSPFTGTFDGQGYEIRDLFINRADESCVGLFAFIDERGQIEDIGLVNATVNGEGGVGGLVGASYGTVSNSYSTGSVTGNKQVGGLVGANVNGTIDNSYSTGSVTGNEAVGGLVGQSWSTVSNSYSTGKVSGNYDVGGLVGWNDGSYVSNSYSTGSVSGDVNVGGLVGLNTLGTIDNSYSTGSVTGNEAVGGLVGENDGTVNDCYAIGNVIGESYVGGLAGASYGTVSNSYSTGSATGNSSVGGLVGFNGYDGTVSNSYSTGSVSGNEDVGGLVGLNDESTVSDSFWDTETSGQATSDGGTGKNTTEMQNIATFSGAGWNIIEVAPGVANPAYIWNIVDGVTYPFLSWQS